jgi:excisionase family DNA binding protein
VESRSARRQACEGDSADEKACAQGARRRGGLHSWPEGASAVSELQAALVDLLRPIVREVVREEVERAKLQWRWLSVRQAAELLDTTPSGIYKRVQRGQLPVKHVGSKVLIDMEMLDHQLDALPSSTNITNKPPRRRRPGARTQGG